MLFILYKLIEYKNRKLIDSSIISFNWFSIFFCIIEMFLCSLILYKIRGPPPTDSFCEFVGGIFLCWK